MPKITVITPTARWGGIDIWKTSLQRQRFDDFEALLLDERYFQRQNEVEAYLSDDTRLQHVTPPVKRSGAFWNLSRSLNFGLALAEGELIVFLQDYIWLPPDALEKLWTAYQTTRPALVSGVGHKAKFPEWAINLQGKLSIFTRSGLLEGPFGEGEKPEDAIQQPEGVWFRDPRIQGRGMHLCNPIEWEGNWSCCPKVIAEAIGGFDEAFDAGWGYDNCNFAERAQLAGFQIWLDEDNPCVGYSHERLFLEDKMKKDAPNNMRLWEQTIEKLQRGEMPFKVPYLGQMVGA